MTAGKAGLSAAGPVQQLDHLMIRRGSEVNVEEADCRESPGGGDGHELVGGIGEGGGGITGSDGRGHHYPICAQSAGNGASGQGSGTCGDPVIDNYGRFPGKIGGGAAPPEHLGLPGHLLSLLAYQAFYVVGPDAESPYPVLVDDLYPAFTQGADRQFRLKGSAQLSHQKDLERRRQPAGNLETHRDPAPGKSEHHGSLASQVIETACQLASGVGPVHEPHGTLPSFLPTSGGWASRVGHPPIQIVILS